MGPHPPPRARAPHRNRINVGEGLHELRGSFPALLGALTGVRRGEAEAARGACLKDRPAPWDPASILHPDFDSEGGGYASFFLGRRGSGIPSFGRLSRRTLGPTPFSVGATASRVTTFCPLPRAFLHRFLDLASIRDENIFETGMVLMFCYGALTLT